MPAEGFRPDGLFLESAFLISETYFFMSRVPMDVHSIRKCSMGHPPWDRSQARRVVDRSGRLHRYGTTVRRVETHLGILPCLNGTRERRNLGYTQASPERGGKSMVVLAALSLFRAGRSILKTKRTGPSPLASS